MANSMRKYYPGITIFKLIGAILVLSGHVRIPQFYKELAFHVTGLEQFFFMIVPCFYIVAGFLAYNGWSHAKNPDQYIKRYLGWITGLYVAIFLLKLVATLVQASLKTGLTAHVLGRLFIKSLYGLLVIGPMMSFWFIPPLIFGITFSYLFNGKGKLLYAGIIAVICFLAAQAIGGTLRAMIDLSFGDIQLFHIKHIQLYQNALVKYAGKGFPFVLMGIVLAKYQDWFLNINSRKLTLTVVGFTLTEGLFLNYFVGGRFPYDVVLSIVPLSIWMFYGLLKVKNDKLKTYHKQINLLSIVIYFAHFIFININLYLLGWNLRAISPMQYVICTLLTLAECLALTALILTLKRKKELAVSTVS
jgi:hypothetical protein